jgi:hypothetical protein
LEQVWYQAISSLCNLEQDGPHLPSFTVGYRNEWFTQKLAVAIVGRSGWTVLIFPTIPLGVGGANEWSQARLPGHICR